jgi:glyoxylase-like metal-dependent hydrolase (beta-lactamase superfamily II)
VDYVLVTPFKSYTVANLHLFPRAIVCVSKHGWAEQYLALRYPLADHDPLSISDETFDRLQRGVANSLQLLRDEDEIVPGVRAFWVGAHDRSSMAYVIRTARGDVVVSDCCFKYENVEQLQPTGTADSLEECLNAYTRMRHEGQLVVPLYDPAVLERFADGRIG